MPRPVVPIRRAPRRSSRARSSAPCDGRISAALSARRSVAGEIASPLSRIVSISASNAQGSTTTPLPMIDSLPGRTTPDGSRLSLYSILPTTSVCPALWPPWKRTTTSARCDSQSTIFPFPSSPHWAPITATLAISDSCFGALPSDWTHLAAVQNMAATKPARLFVPVESGLQRRDRDPPLLAQRADAGATGLERYEQAAARHRLRQCAQDRVGVQREPGRRLGRGRVAGLVATAAPQLTKRPTHRIDTREKRKADAGVVLEAAVLDRIYRHFDVRDRGIEAMESRAETVALDARRWGEIEPIERDPGWFSETGGRDQGGEQFARLADQTGDRGNILAI